MGTYDRRRPKIADEDRQLALFADEAAKKLEKALKKVQSASRKLTAELRGMEDNASTLAGSTRKVPYGQSSRKIQEEIIAMRKAAEGIQDSLFKKGLESRIAGLIGATEDALKG
jgi:hypothetical protein